MPPSASAGEIRDAFVTLIRKYRDKPGETDVAVIERARQINLAYDRLGDPVQRRTYDESRGIFFPQQASETESAEQMQDSTGGSETDRDAPPSSQVEESPQVGESPDPRIESDVQEPPLAAGALEDGESERAEAADRIETAEESPRDRSRTWWAAGALVPVLAAAALLSWLLSGPEENGAPGPLSGDGVTAEVTPSTVDPAGSPLATIPSLEGAVEDAGQAEAVMPSPAQEADAGATNAAVERPANIDRQPPPAPPAPPAPASAAPTSPSETTPRLPGRVAANPPTGRPTASPNVPVAVGTGTAVVNAGRPETPARWVRGGLLDRDNPGGRLQGTVNVRFTVDRTGRATDCRLSGGSGDAALGAMTCRLVEQRLVFSPALNAAGQPVPSELRTTYTWGGRRRR